MRRPPRPGLAPAAELLAATRRFSTASTRSSARPRPSRGTARNGAAGIISASAGFIKPGLRLEQMSAVQKAAAWDLLATLFSPAGIEKTRNVMLLQDVLAASGNGAGQRSSKRFSFAVFGHAGRDRRLGLPPRRPSPDAIDQRARRADRFGHAVVVLGAAGDRITSGKHAGLDHAEGRRGAGAASCGRSCRQAARAAVGVAALQHHVLCGARAVEHAEGRHRGRRHDGRAARPVVATGRDLFGAAPASRRSPPRRRSACAPAIARRCISPGTDRTSPRRRSAIG